MRSPEELKERSREQREKKNTEVGFFLGRSIASAVCDCCIIIIALKDMIEAVTLSNLLSVGYFGLGCHDPSLSNSTKVIVPEAAGFTCLGTFSFE